MPITRKSLAYLAVVAAGGLSLSACATTEYVDEQIAAVNTRIDGVDAKASQAATAAAAAQAQAQAAATDAQNANRRLDQLTGRVDRVEQAQAAQRRPRN
jgi:outer membrane murein-binding lipoprotein Lpp